MGHPVLSYFVEFVVVADGEDHGVDLPEQLNVVGGDVAQVYPAQLARHLWHLEHRADLATSFQI